MSADFLDSNLFVYLFDETDARKRAVATRLVAEGIASGEACISFQVVQETLSIVTGKLKKRASESDARELFENVLAPLWRSMPSPALYLLGLNLQARHSLSYYDSLIVAAALEAGCTRLLTEDLQDGRKFDRLKIVNPFRPGAA